MATTEPLLTYAEVSRIWSIPRGTLYALVSERRIPHIRIGPRFVRFVREDLIEWIESHRCDAVKGGA